LNEGTARKTARKWYGSDAEIARAGGTAILSFARKSGWETWLDKNHRTSSGVWLRLAKKASGLKSISYDEALELALCYGWIDGQGKSDGDKPSPSRITVPDDLQTALDRNTAAKRFFEALDRRNRYAILFRIHTARKAETRANRIQQFIRMMARGENPHP
jgi:uncharacterized protein YdeI (YjbR/CyaY-like superfamily)